MLIEICIRRLVGTLQQTTTGRNYLPVVVFSFHRNCRLLIQRQYIPRKHLLVHLLHLPSYELLRELGVVARHVSVRVSENLCQHVDRHPVFHSQTSEGMSSAVCGQILRDIAQVGDFFQISIHLLITRNGQQFSCRS